MLCAGDCGTSDAARERGAALIEQLARQATTTTDPRVYALAFTECDRVQRRGSCALLSAEQWARLDDGNGAPWLAALSAAQRRGDAAEADEAIHRIGAATRWSQGAFAAAAAVAAHAGKNDVDLLAAELLATDAALQGAARSPPFQALTRACAVELLADSNRRQACDRAASALADRSDTSSASLVGAAIGGRVGWPEERMDAIRGLREAQVAMTDAALPADTVRGELPVTCAGARRVLAFWSNEGRLGELQAVRDWLAATGQTLAPYAAKAHALRAAASPSIASATSGPLPLAARAASSTAAASALRGIDASTATAAAASSPASSSLAAAPAAALTPAASMASAAATPDAVAAAGR